MYTSKYRPKKLEDFIGNKDVIQPFIKWLLEWDVNDKKNKCILLSGLCGIGKTLLVELILKKHDYNIINIAIDDDRDKNFMTNVVKPLTNTKKTHDGQENVLVFSDIDSGSDYGFISSLTECIKETKIPIVCICDNRFDQSIKPILNYCFDIKMKKPSYEDTYRLLYNVVINEKIRIKESEIKELYDQSNGDIRFLLNTLQFGMRNSKKNIQSTNIFESTGKLMSMEESFDEKYNMYWLSHDLHPLMVQENYINNTFGVREEHKKLTNISYSADALSDADIFEHSVNMTNWEMEPYVAFSVINATSKCNKKTIMKFPQFLGRTSTMNKNKREKIKIDEVKYFEDKHGLKAKNVMKKVEMKETKEKKPKGRPKKVL
jgi:replication factor C subunit 1